MIRLETINLRTRFYYVDGSEQFIKIKTDSIELTIEDFEKRITNKECITITTDDGDVILINPKNIINIKFEWL